MARVRPARNPGRSRRERDGRGRGGHTVPMDRALVLLDARVAEAAEAWLTDPRDAGVYGRLVTAVQARRRSLTPPAAVPAGPDGAADVRPDATPAQGSDEDVDGLAADRLGA